MDGLADQLIHFGADRVVVVNDDKLNSYTTDAYQQAMLQVIAVENPEGIIIGHTAIGKDVSPRLAMMLDAGLVSDVIAIELDGGEPTFTRPIYSGKAFEKKKIILITLLSVILYSIFYSVKFFNNSPILQICISFLLLLSFVVFCRKNNIGDLFKIRRFFLKE